MQAFKTVGTRNPNPIIQNVAKSVKFKIYEHTSLKEVQKIRAAKEYELREFVKDRSISVGRNIA